MSNVKAGGSYIFSACNSIAGPNTGGQVWDIDFTIVAPSGAVDAFGLDPMSDCELSWTASESGEYTIIVNEAGNCGATTNLTINNGYPAITYTGGASCDPPITDCIAGTNNGATATELCPGETATITFSGTVVPNSPTIGEVLYSFNPVDIMTYPDGEIVLGGATAGDNELVFDNTLGGLLPGAGLPAFVGEFEISLIVTSDAGISPFELTNRCDQSEVFVVNFFADGEPGCDPAPTCEAGDVVAGSQSVCPGDDVSLALTGEDVPNDPLQYGVVWFFENLATLGTFEGFIVTDPSDPALYNFTGDLNAEIIAQGGTPLLPGTYRAYAGIFDFNALLYCDFTDNFGVLGDPDAQLVTLLDENDPECSGPAPCEAPFPQIGGLDAVQPLDGSVDLTWAPVNGQQGVRIQIGLPGGPFPFEDILIGANQSNFFIPANVAAVELSPGTTYAFRVQAGCGTLENPTLGPFSDEFSFLYLGALGISENTTETANDVVNLKPGSREVLSAEYTPRTIEALDLTQRIYTLEEKFELVRSVDVYNNRFIGSSSAEYEVELGLYPNPTEGMVNVNYSAAADGMVNVRVFDVLGKVVADQTVAVNAGSNFIDMDLSSLKAGIYVVEVLEGGQSSTARLLME